jgi:hypothetical protein
MRTSEPKLDRVGGQAVSYAFETLIGPYVDQSIAREILRKRWFPPIPREQNGTGQQPAPRE